MSLPENLKYTESHEWLKLEESTGTVGITDHAQNELSDIVFVETPQVGTSVTAKDPIAVVESVKAASDIYAPVSGEIVAVNETLSDNPELVNESPYEKGWLFKIKLSDSSEAESLKNSSEYSSLIS